MKNLFLIVITIFALAGCRGSKSLNTTYYLIEFPSHKEINFETPAPIPVDVELDGININPAFSSHQIVLREESHQIRYFSSHKWAVRPDQSIERFILTFFERNKFFQNFGTRLWKTSPDYKLKIFVYQMEIIQERNEFLAKFHLEIQLQNLESGQVVITHIADRIHELDSKNINLFADAISTILYDELCAFSQKVAERFADE